MIILNISGSAQPPSEQGHIPACWEFFTFLTFILNCGIHQAHCLNQETLKSEMLITSEGSRSELTYLTQKATIEILGQFTGAALLSPSIWNNKIRPFQINYLMIYTFVTVSAQEFFRQTKSILKSIFHFFGLAIESNQKRTL